LKQTDHLKSYGVAFWLLEKNGEVDCCLITAAVHSWWITSDVLARECPCSSVFFESLAAAKPHRSTLKVQREDNKSDVVRLEKAPRIAVYAPPGFQTVGWRSDDDSIEYAEIHYTKVWDEEILSGKLSEYDWLHFTSWRLHRVSMEILFRFRMRSGISSNKCCTSARQSVLVIKKCRKKKKRSHVSI